MWKNTVEPNRPQMTIWRKGFASGITKATNTHSEYVILTAFALQLWLHKRLSKLRYTYTASILNHSSLPRFYLSHRSQPPHLHHNIWLSSYITKLIFKQFYRAPVTPILLSTVLYTALSRKSQSFTNPSARRDI
jgi:hypothetical protein